MILSVRCKIQRIGEAMRLSNNFVCAEMDAKTIENNPQMLKFRFCNNKAKLLEHLREGDDVQVTFELVGREWNNPGKQYPEVFVSLEALEVKLANGEKVKPNEVNDFNEMEY